MSRKEDQSTANATKKICHVFWDYENCQKPSDRTFEETYVAIRDYLETMNISMLRLNVYSDEDIMGKGARQTLNDLGCNVVNPSKLVGNCKKKETSDLRIAVDMSMFAFDNAHCPERCAIMLITSDSDFGHLLSSMRSRNFETILISNKVAPPRLTVHATSFVRMFDLFVQIEETLESGSETDTVTHSLESLQYNSKADNETNSIVAQQFEQEILRVDDLVALVQELQSQSLQDRVYDSAVGIAFSRRFPALGKKKLYKDTKLAAFKLGRLFPSEIPNPAHPTTPTHLISTHRSAL